MIVKLTQVNEGKVISVHDQVEILQTWLELHACAKSSLSSGKNMKDGLIKVAASMYVTDGVLNTPASIRIAKAKECAKLGKSLNEIKAHIKEAVWILTK